MFVNAKKLSEGTKLTADICIIGAGVAGITLAMALIDQGKRILLIEAGGLKGSAGAQKLYHGHSSNTAFHQMPDSDRVRGLGGTSAIWGGRCMPYDSQDFEARDHMVNSGWPFGLDVLAPYYRAAQQAADCGGWAYTASKAGLPGDMIEGAQTDALHLDSLERWSPPTHFGKSHRAALGASTNITVLTGAVATELIYQNGRVTQVRLQSTKTKRQISVVADQVVLAGGGLEVPRLLMHSATDTAPALGDQSGWLGRGYMSHVGGVIARLKIATGRKVIFGYEQDGDGIYVRRRLTLSAQAQAQHRLPNMYALLDRPLLDDASHNSAILSLAFLAKRLVQRQSQSDGSDTGKFALYKSHFRNLLFGAPEVLSVLPRFGRNRFLTGRRVPSLLLTSGDNSFYLYFHAEQSANHDAQISLADDRDAMGMRRLQIDAHLSEADAEGVIRAHQLIGAELEKSGAGHLEFLGDDPMALIRKCKSTLGHHIGATRMARTAENGVVDPDCKVFGTENLYVASASVLPSSSQAHPTLTILALALRLAERLNRL